MKIYDEIYKEFDETRTYVWPTVKRYIDAIPTRSMVLDVGSGNGKNQYRRDIDFISLDSSINMCGFVNESINACATKLPFRDEMFDYTISIACVHHINTLEKRREAINEMIRVTKKGGSVFFSMWEAQEKYGKYDSLVKWKTKQKLRYYYLSTDECMMKLLSGYEYKVEKEKNNYYVKITL